MAKQELEQSTKPRLASDENNHKHIFLEITRLYCRNNVHNLRHKASSFKLSARLCDKHLNFL
jgi:hypothetical protein